MNNSDCCYAEFLAVTVELTSFLPMLLRTRAPTPSACSTLKTVLSTLLTFMVLGEDKTKDKMTIKRTYGHDQICLEATNPSLQ